MKSSGIICSSPRQLEGKHAFLFSLRSLQPDKRRKLDIQLDFSANNFQFELTQKNQKTSNCSCIDPSDLLPLFSKGSQKKFNGFVTADEHAIFQQENKAIFTKLVQQSQARKESQHEIMQPLPKSNYCQICRETFSDYLKHLSHPVHKKNFEAQCKNTMIDDLIKSFDSQGQSNRRNRRCIDDQQAEQIGMPSKIRVIQLQDTLTPIRMNCSNTAMQPINNCYSAQKQKNRRSDE